MAAQRPISVNSVNGRPSLRREAARDVALFVFSVIPGVIALTGLASGSAQLAWRVAAVVLALALIARLLFLYRKSRLLRVSQQIEAVTSRFDRFREIVDELVDLQPPLHEETQEIHVFVGRDSDDDHVLERFQTQPDPQVTQRSIRFIVPSPAERQPSLEDLDLRATAEEGQETDVCVAPVPLREEPYLRGLVYFDPPLLKRTTWSVEYRTTGMWDPLRATGSDFLKWHCRARLNVRDRSPISELTVKFYFPNDGRVPRVTERMGHGKVSSQPVRHGERLVIEWRHSGLTSQTFEWRITWRRPVKR